MVAFSGGPDSVCLLHQLAGRRLNRTVRAVHVDHGLDRGSARRASLALEIAADLDVECQVERVQVRRSGSVEANARQVRYTALEAHIDSGAVLLTAHHADDVAETMLLRLLRGSGPGGLGGIPERRRFGHGWLLRPLLGWRRPHIEQYLKKNGLRGVHDPANDLASMDRNFIRHEIMPLLRERFPGCVNGMTRSAALNRSAAAVLSGLAADDVRAMERPGPRLELELLRRLDPYRRSEALRRWCLQHGLAPPPGARLDEFLRQIEAAGGDRHPAVRWDDGEIRRHGRALWLNQPEPDSRPWQVPWNGREPLDLPGRCGRLQLRGPVPEINLKVCSGQPGERIQLGPTSGRQAVKKLLAGHGVPPWLRPLWPRIWQGERLVGLADRWLDDGFSSWLKTHNGVLVWESALPACRIASDRPGRDSHESPTD